MPAGQPSVRATSRIDVGRREPEAEPAVEELGRLGAGEPQLVGAQLGELPVGAQRPERELRVGARGDHQLDAGRQVRREPGDGRGVGKAVEVVEHQRDVAGLGERVDEPRQHDLAHRRGHRQGRERLVVQRRADAAERLHDVRPEDDVVVVALVERDPGHRPPRGLLLAPRGEQRGLAEPRGAGDERQRPALAQARGQPLRDGLRGHERRVQLGDEEDRRLGTHCGLIHAGLSVTGGAPRGGRHLVASGPDDALGRPVADLRPAPHRRCAAHPGGRPARRGGRVRRRLGRRPPRLPAPVLDAPTCLAAVAAVTERVELGVVELWTAFGAEDVVAEQLAAQLAAGVTELVLMPYGTDQLEQIEAPPGRPGPARRRRPIPRPRSPPLSTHQYDPNPFRRGVRAEGGIERDIPGAVRDPAAPGALAALRPAARGRRRAQVVGGPRGRRPIPPRSGSRSRSRITRSPTATSRAAPARAR